MKRDSRRRRQESESSLTSAGGSPTRPKQSLASDLASIVLTSASPSINRVDEAVTTIIGREARRSERVEGRESAKAPTSGAGATDSDSPLGRDRDDPTPDDPLDSSDPGDSDSDVDCPDSDTTDPSDLSDSDDFVDDPSDDSSSDSDADSDGDIGGDDPFGPGDDRGDFDVEDFE